MVGDDTIAPSADTNVDVTEVFPQQKMCNTLPSGKVASLQKRFESQKQAYTLNTRKHSYQQQYDSPSLISSSSGASSSTFSISDSSSGDFPRRSEKNHILPLSPGYDNVSTDEHPGDLDARLAKAIEENDKIFRTFGTINSKSPVSSQDRRNSNSEGNDTPSVSARIKNFNSNISHTMNYVMSSLPRQQSSEFSEGQAPSPPPRVPIFSSSHNSSSPVRNGSPEKSRPSSPKKVSSSSDAASSLSKSASHGDIAGRGAPNSSQSNGSTSSEDLRIKKNSQSSSLKQNVLSSNDSLTSSSSLVTVKSASLKSLDDDPPELPPRNNRNAMKPPLPRSASQVSSKDISLQFLLYTSYSKSYFSLFQLKFVLK